MSKIASLTSQTLGAITNCKPMKKCCNYFKENPSKAIAYTTIASVVGKDGIGCYMYVNQSLNNKKIPDDKRKFVAALDLTNGLLMIGTQLALFFTMRKFNKPLFNKLFKKSFDKAGEVKKTVTTQVRMLQNKAGMKPVSRKLEIHKNYDQLKKECFNTFTFIAELVAATVVAKRVIVPFIATPLAGKAEKWMDKRAQKSAPCDDKKPEVIEEEHTAEKTAGEKLDITCTGNSNLLGKYKNN